MNKAEMIVSLLNGAAVSVFGSMLSASFSGALAARSGRRAFWLAAALMLIPQSAAYLFWGTARWAQFYPLLVHIPLLFLLRALTGKWLWPAISILSAYLFCQMRRWPALLVAALLPRVPAAQELAELAFTVPWLVVLLRFASPAVRQMMEHPARMQCQFGLIPALYYGFDYLTRIYTDLLSRGSPVVVEFMPTVCCGAYIIFLLHNSAEEGKRTLLRQTQENLKLQVAQATHEITQLRESQAAAARYRHDLRHHLQYLFSCIENGQAERAKDYISGICAELEAQQVRRYCENEAANLILSAFADRAEKTGIEMDVRGALPAVISVVDSDLCVILSNALENAFHACLLLAEAGTACTIGVKFSFQKQNGRLFLQVINPCREVVRFEKGLPVSDRPGHGIGVQSIQSLVKKYGGGCTFQAENGRFTLRLFL